MVISIATTLLARQNVYDGHRPIQTTAALSLLSLLVSNIDTGHLRFAGSWRHSAEFEGATPAVATPARELVRSTVAIPGNFRQFGQQEALQKR